MSIRVERSRVSVRSIGSGGVDLLHTYPRRGPGGGMWRVYGGCLASRVGHVRVIGHELTGSAREPDRQEWHFSVIDTRTGMQHNRVEKRTRRDFLTPRGAGRVALRWARRTLQ